MKIEIHNTTYIFLLISFLAGYFEYMYLLLIVIFVHESGHYILGQLNNIKIKKIVMYPFGGITVLDCDLNISINKELITLLGGIIFQILFVFIIKKLYIYEYLTLRIFNIIKEINIILISFNFLPILPLDGGKITNLIFDKIFPYKISHEFSIYVSFITVIIFVILHKTYFSIILSLYLIKELVIEYKNKDIRFNKFILERYLKKYKFKKIKVINKIINIKRDNYHIINNIYEEKYLTKMFDRSI